jgi:5-methylcytosine-specific restriction endonuclease McrA
MDTLVLSQGYEPVARVSWQRAITLLFSNKAELVEEYPDREIHSVTFTIKMPSIIRFLRNIRRRKSAVKFSRENVLVRDSEKCQYCGRKVTLKEFTYDHVVPRSQGGLTTWENVVVCCVDCNQKKACRTPEQAGMRLINKPVKPKKLPERVRFVLTFQNGMPESWKQFASDYRYWNSSLEEG